MFEYAGAAADVCDQEFVSKFKSNSKIDQL